MYRLRIMLFAITVENKSNCQMTIVILKLSYAVYKLKTAYKYKMGSCGASNRVYSNRMKKRSKMTKISFDSICSLHFVHLSNVLICLDTYFIIYLLSFFNSKYCHNKKRIVLNELRRFFSKPKPFFVDSDHKLVENLHRS